MEQKYMTWKEILKQGKIGDKIKEGSIQPYHAVIITPPQYTHKSFIIDGKCLFCYKIGNLMSVAKIVNDSCIDWKNPRYKEAK